MYLTSHTFPKDMIGRGHAYKERRFFRISTVLRVAKEGDSKHGESPKTFRESLDSVPDSTWLVVPTKKPCLVQLKKKHHVLLTTHRQSHQDNESHDLEATTSDVQQRGCE